jgi:hypothetical protein
LFYPLDPALLRQIAGVVFDYIFTGKPRSLGSLHAEKLVEYGVARFNNRRDILADEPLALLAIAHYFTAEKTWNLEYFLVDALTTSNESARGIALEHFGAYLLGLAFKSPRKLSSVFKNFGSNALGDEVGELVAIHRIDGECICNRVDISSDEGPTYILGRSPRTEEETLQWLENPRRSVFCFPVHTLGPDLIFMLRLSDGRVIRVLVQFKHNTQSKMGPKETEDALHSVDPEKFLSQRSMSSSPTSDALPTVQNLQYVLLFVCCLLLTCGF